MIRRWCDAMGETNPAYTDPVWAERSVFGGVVAPPAMMDVFDKPGLVFLRDADNPQTAVLVALEGIGCTSTVAVNSELEYGRYLRLATWSTAPSSSRTSATRSRRAWAPATS